MKRGSRDRNCGVTRDFRCSLNLTQPEALAFTIKPSELSYIRFDSNTMARSVARRPESEDPSLSIRRSHMKSRRGCIICKQRKVKCDETRPRCRRCEYGDRPCSYQHDIREGKATSSKPATTPTSTSTALPTTTTTTATASPGASSTSDSAANGPSWSANQWLRVRLSTPQHST